ncbi:Repetin [Streptomyces atratus]|uniref:Repetin n=1 Tax=Streptomyces atratus TaxID=1893 RepID=UPI0033D818B0
MTRVAHTRTRLAAIATALLITAGAAGSAAALGDWAPGSARGQREAAALTGTAKLYRPAGDDITFTFDAHLAAKDTMDPGKAYSTFRFHHVFPNGTSGWAEGSVDCLVTGGKVAVVTGVVTATDIGIMTDRQLGAWVKERGRRACIARRRIEPWRMGPPLLERSRELGEHGD